MVNVVKAGYSNFNRNNHSLAGFKGGANPDILGIPSFGWGAPPRVTFTGYSVGAVVQHHNQDLSSVRDDLTMSFDARGRHDIKTGGEYIYNLANLVGCGSLCTPRLIAQGASAANSAALLRAAFPVWNDTSTWNMNALAPISTRYEASFTDIKGFYRTIPQDTLRILAAGRLEDHVTPDAQPRRPLRLPEPRRPGADPAAVSAGAALERQEQRGAAAWRRLHAERSDGIRGGYGIFFAQGTQDEAHQTILYQIGASPLVPVRRPCGFPDQSVQRRKPDIQLGPREFVRLEQQPRRLHRPAVHSRDQQPVLGDAVQSPGVDRRRASDRRGDVVPVERGLHRWPQRGVRSEHQPCVQPGDRSELTTTATRAAGRCRSLVPCK